MQLTPPAFATLIALATLAAVPAAADPLRAPPSGAPALQIDAPAGWKTKRIDVFGASIAAASDRNGLVAIAIVPSHGAAPPLRDLVQRLAGAPFGSDVQSSPALLDGRAAEAFTATEPRKGAQAERHARYEIARIDDHHVGIVVAVTAADQPEAERKQIEAAAAGARVIAAAAPAK